MKSIFTLSMVCLSAGCSCFAQVKGNYLYSTTMPYGTLDIRTWISSTNYYYLQENRTFSFRESSPGVRTNTYVDMTPFESSAYKQGNLRRKNGTRDDFVMNYRLLFPNAYNSAYAEGYPMVVMMHGAMERANCYYTSCYHGTWSYNAVANSPAAPKTSTHKLLNNDHNLSIGGKQHLDARNQAGTRLPHDPTMPSRAFPGFVLVPQMFNEWEPLQVQDMIRIVRLLAAKYRINPDRIYIHGLSIGGYAVYEALQRASWLFAGALPMSASGDAKIFQYNQGSKVAHVPVWIFQGGKDTRPTPAYTQGIINNLKKYGAVVRYSYYADLAHAVWNRAYAEADFFSWMLRQRKNNIHAFAGNLVINKSKGQYPKLMLAEGFMAYQWEKNGTIISGASSNAFTATTPGTYRARFSRISTAPTSTQWNKWSAYVKVTEVTTATAIASTSSTRMEAEEVRMPPGEEGAEEFSFDVYPNPATAGNLSLELHGAEEAPVQVRIVDQLGRELYSNTFDTPALATGQPLALPSSSRGGIYILMVNQGQRQVRRKVVLGD